MTANFANKLNPYLSDLVLMYLKLHDFHWKIKGNMFVQVHLYTEERYNDMSLKFDEVAEKIIMSGEAPVSTIKQYLELASIKELGKDSYSDVEVLKEVLKDLTYLKEKASELHKYFDEEGAFSVVGMLETHIEGYEKEIWFLKSMIA